MTLQELVAVQIRVFTHLVLVEHVSIAKQTIDWT